MILNKTTKKSIDFSKAIKPRYGSLYDPKLKEFKLSRSKIDLFVRCPLCFYLDVRLGVKQPSMPSFTLNNATDTLLKKEFDMYREKQTAHPIMIKYGLNQLTPFKHPELDKWRDNFKGISYIVKDLNLKITGAIDDIWTDGKQVYIVDYKSTAKENGIDMNDKWKLGYKRQLEIYQWLFVKNKFTVGKQAFFVYVNGDTTKPSFDYKLEFEMFLFEHKGNPSWVDDVLKQIHNCLNQDELPQANQECEYCKYREQANLF